MNRVFHGDRDHSFGYQLLRLLMLSGILVAFTADVHAGFLYVLNQQNATPNQIHGFSVNEATGALTLLTGFPMSSGGNGVASSGSHQLTVDRVNRRLYAINDGSNTVSAFSIDGATGALTPLPFSPIVLPAGTWTTIAVHPSGSPLIVGDGDATPFIASFNITPTSATAAAGSPFSTGTARPGASAFSRDGFFLYAGGNATNFIAGFSVNPTTGALTPLPGSPFDSGAGSPLGYATDSKGRLFTTSALSSALRAFTTSVGIPTAVSGNPFPSGVGFSIDAALHPNERFYYAADQSLSRVSAFQISGEGAATTLSLIGAVGVASGGSQTLRLALNGSGLFLYAINDGTRNISTYSVNSSTGALTFGNVQTVNTLGTTGNLTGIAYQPAVFNVTKTNNGGAGSLRQAVQDGNTTGGVIVFDPTVFNVPRTIFFTSGGQLAISSNITIAGPGANLLTLRNTQPISGSARIINISNSDHSVDLRGMTLTGGRTLGDGGGISNIFFSVLTIRDCVISDNVSNGEGGGIANVGTLNVINSTISGNTSNATNSGGGGIDSLGPTFVTNSTISGNTKITNTTNGAGGIFIGNAALTMTNSTITNNSSNNGASGVFDGSGGGSPVLAIRNSIIAGNRNNSAVPDVSGSFTSGGFNLIGNVGVATGFNQTGDQTGTGASPINPGLVKVLAWKGGTVPTHVPLPSSPAVDKGNSFNMLNDQRGFARLFDNPAIPNTADGADIGAFERRARESIFTAPFDFDADGKTDLGIFRSLADAQWWINPSSTGAIFAVQFGSSSTPITPADFTGDGKTDIAVWRPADGTWLVLRSENFSFFGFPFGQNGDIPVPADYDGDAKADPAVYRPNGSVWFSLRSSDGGVTIDGFGSAGDRPVPGDYDGDGRTDLAIYRPSSGQWWLNRTTDGIIVATFGGATDKSVPGDYTGDGKIDIAFWRPATGTWFVLRSEDFSFFGFPFGISTDIPAPGDYDGDGKSDATIFRPAEATWYSLRTSGGTSIQPFGSTGDRPIPNAFVQ